MNDRYWIAALTGLLCMAPAHAAERRFDRPLYSISGSYQGTDRSVDPSRHHPVQGTHPRRGPFVAIGGYAICMDPPVLDGRNTTAAFKDRIVLDSRVTGFAALDAAKGDIRGQDKHIYAISGGDHNWTWHIVSDGKIIRVLDIAGLR